MDKTKKTVFTALSLLCIIFLVYTFIWILSDISLYKNMLELHKDTNGIREHYMPIIKKHTIGAIATCLSSLCLAAVNLLMWFNKPLFGVPLTPEQAAERKRVIAERKRARLQEKLNKLND